MQGIRKEHLGKRTVRFLTTLAMLAALCGCTGKTDSRQNTSTSAPAVSVSAPAASAAASASEKPTLSPEITQRSQIPSPEPNAAASPSSASYRTETSHTAAGKDDEVNRYDDPEDYYEDFYDDFDDYEDAEDYYYENHD